MTASVVGDAFTYFVFRVSPVHLDICGIPVRISANSSAILSLCQTYFRFYSASIPAGTSSARLPSSLRPIEINLKLVTGTSLLTALIPPDAEFIGEQSLSALWRHQHRRCEHYYFHFNFGCALFRVEPVRGKVVGLIAQEALEFPHLMVNTYLFMTLMLALRWRSIYHLHTAAVVSPQQRLTLICGAPRAGKTTLTAALGVAGWHPISDDGVMLQATSSGSLTVQAFKRDFHLAKALLQQWRALQQMDVQYFYHDRACVDGLTFFKTAALADTVFPHVAQILLPQISGEKESRLEPLAPSEALRHLIGQSMFFPLDEEHTNRQLVALAKLVKETSCYRLMAGTDIWDDPLCTGRLLSSL